MNNLLLFASCMRVCDGDLKVIGGFEMAEKRGDMSGW